MLMITKYASLIASICLTLLPPSVGALRSVHWDRWLIHVLMLLLFFPVSQVQKQNYRQEKKRAAKELFSALKDPSVVIMSNWLKVWGCCLLDRAATVTPRIITCLQSHWQQAIQTLYPLSFTLIDNYHSSCNLNIQLHIIVQQWNSSNYIHVYVY